MIGLTDFTWVSVSKNVAKHTGVHYMADYAQAMMMMIIIITVNLQLTCTFYIFVPFVICLFTGVWNF